MFASEISFATFIAEHRTESFTTFFSGVTELGDVWFCVFFAVLLAALLYGTKHSRYAAGLLLASIGSGCSVWALKLFFALPRPFDPIALISIDSFSFPSGHAAAAAALYGFIIYIVSKTIRTNWRGEALIAALGALIILIGFSRLYLGVHYLSDVVAGYIVGFVWARVGTYVSKRR